MPYGIGITYGIRGIKISKLAIGVLIIISLVASSIAILVGKFFHYMLPPFVTEWLGSVILIIMGIILLFQAIQKPNTYDIDNSKHIDSKEAISLGIALSLDSFSIGIGTGVLEGNVLFWLFPLLVAEFQMLFLSVGKILGRKLKNIFHIPEIFWSILAASILIIMGFITI
ncbi:MAG: hypothetical protein HFJ28_04785 [Clostridia bacterium]|jgi:putative Mn2+ efflux pump MntP|nr:hypothetical protein [Clostridia bacterium]